MVQKGDIYYMMVIDIFQEITSDDFVYLMDGDEGVYDGKLGGIPEKYYNCTVDHAFPLKEEPFILCILINQVYKPVEEPSYDSFYDD